MDITDRKRRQIVEMWNCGKTVRKIARELRVSPMEVTEVIGDLYSEKSKTKSKKAG